LLPIIDLGWQHGVVWFVDPDADSSIVHLVEVAVDAFATVEVAKSRVGSEAGHRHDSSVDVKASNLDDPLKSGNH
jgi:hypothetical protein